MFKNKTCAVCVLCSVWFCGSLCELCRSRSDSDSIFFSTFSLNWHILFPLCCTQRCQSVECAFEYSDGSIDDKNIAFGFSIPNVVFD